MTHRTVIWPDVHAPNHDKPSIRAALSFLDYYKPHRFIQLGDFCDWDSVTSYDPRREEDIVNIDDEVSVSNELLDDIESHLPGKCEKVMIGGNHEARYTKFKAKHGTTIEFKRMRRFSTWYEQYRLPERGWSFCDYGQWREYGKIVYSHGWFASDNSAEKMLRCFSKNVVFGHTHRHLVSSMMDVNHDPIESESIGTLSRFDLSYLQGKPPINWIHGFMYIDTVKDDTFTKNFVRIINGRFIQHNRIFS